MKSTKPTRLIGFLKEELAIPEAWIELAQRQGQQDPYLLPTVLWQYGLLTLSQLDQVFDWLSTV